MFRIYNRMSMQKTLLGDMPIGGWVDRLAPQAWRPYIRLMRLDRPIGTYLVMWPTLWSTTLAAEGWPNWWYLALFVIGSFVMRGAGCTVNDYFDAGFDASVARTANRPIPSGQVKRWQAILFFIVLCLIGFAVLIQFNTFAIAVGAASLFLFIPYPLMKRVTYWPQVWLGLTFNWGAFVGWAAVTETIAWPAVAMYVGGIFWTLGYDTIYAHMDKEDDVKVGVKSAALVLGEKTKPFVFVVYGAALSLFVAAGFLAGVSWAFYVVLIPALLHLLWQAWTVDIHDGMDCLSKFKSNRNFGLFMWLAFLAGRVVG